MDPDHLIGGCGLHGKPSRLVCRAVDTGLGQQGSNVNDESFDTRNVSIGLCWFGRWPRRRLGGGRGTHLIPKLSQSIQDVKRSRLPIDLQFLEKAGAGRDRQAGRRRKKSPIYASLER
jgi:hypothetical protein